MAIAAGDLVLFIQMQDATINSADTSNYGAGSGTGSGYTGGTAGTYEFAVANSTVSLTGGTLTLPSPGLLNAYTNATATTTQGKKSFQVLRVPQYSSATLGTTSSNNGTTAGSAPPWDYSTGTGGVFVVDVAGVLNLGGGSIDVSGLGFRGGGGLNQAGCGSSGCASTTAYRLPSTNGSGGSKGEGIAGTPARVGNQQTSAVVTTGQANDGYPNGSFDRGAPGNAGGGGNDGDPSGNDQNSGGGGGGNGGAGGQGGNSWSSGLTVGGLGGSIYPATSTKIVMGGGGGAATSNNDVNYNTSGGAGGGIVILRAGSVTGSGTILANGSAGQSAAQDGAGGGGAGGTVVAAVKSGTLSGLTINANGGVGGNAWPTSAPGTNNINEHGPGGGGGGGAVLQSGSATVSVTGGAHGTSTTGLLQYGSTNGAAGLSSSTTYTALPGTHSGAACIPVLTVTKLTTTANVPDGGTATYTITVKNAASVAAATQVSISDTLPEPITNGFTYKANVSITLTGATQPTTSNPTAAAIVPAWGTFTIPASGQVVITFTVAVGYGVPAATYQNPATATYLDPTRTTTAGTTSSSYNSSSSAAEDVTVTTAVVISGFVYSDINTNGTLDSGETWTGSTVYVNLILSGAVSQSATIPAGTGAYTFNGVIAGTYTIVLASSAIATTGTVPTGWVMVSPSSPSIALTTSLSSYQNENFGLFKGNKISGKVFQDNGITSGTPNDGKINGGETGVSDVPLTATNGSGTTYDSEVTAGGGTYTMWIPSSATTVVINTSPPSGYLATGADPGNTGGTYNRTAGTLTFTNTGIVYTGVNFGIVLVNSFNTDNSATTLPNSTVFYPHMFQATTGGQVTFTTSAIPSPSGSFFTEVAYRDTGCTGTMASGDSQITSALTVTAGTTVCILVKESVDPGTPLGARDSITVTANFTYTNASPALSASYTHADVTTVGNSTAAGLDLSKSVDKATAKSGDTLTYTVTFVNDSTGSLTNIVINDSTPAYTTFVSAACPGTLPTGLTCVVTTQPSVGAAGSIRWTLTGSLLPAGTAKVTYAVKIN